LEQVIVIAFFISIIGLEELNSDDELIHQAPKAPDLDTVVEINLEDLFWSTKYA